MNGKPSEGEARRRYHFHSSCKVSEKEKTKIKRCPSDCDCSNDSCPNAGSWRECPASCNKRPGKCLNQHFRSKNPLPVTTRKTRSKGIGLFADHAIEPESITLPFVGEVISKEEWEKRAEKYARDNIPSYPFESDTYIIDATVYGNATKYINHSCDPNLSAERWKVDGTPKDFRAIALIPTKRIGKGEELTLDYRFGATDDSMIKCTCGAATCSGVVGKSKEDLEEMEDLEQMEQQIKEARKIQKKAQNQKKPQMNNAQKIPTVQKTQMIQKRKVQKKKKMAKIQKQEKTQENQKTKMISEVPEKVQKSEVKQVRGKKALQIQKIKKTQPNTKIGRIPVAGISKRVLRNREIIVC